ncbi:MAG: NAD(P)/FAD-dependent oxidoreductase [Bacillota bacterium]
MTYDYIIIGAGLIGTNIARELMKYDVRALMLEKENDVCNHASMANSAIVHSGHDPKPGTLKAKFNVEGNRLYDELEDVLDIPLLRNGALVVARNEEDNKMLKDLYERALENGVDKVALLDREEALKREPNLTPKVTMALDLPTTKITYPWEVTLANAENAIENGLEFKKSTAVTGIEKHDGIFTVTTDTGESYETRSVINAAGAFTDKIAAMVEEKTEYEITPRRGEYFVIDRHTKGFVNHTLYPTPSEKGKGVLIVPQVHGETLIGPTSEFQDDPENIDNTKEGLSYVRKNATNLSEKIPFKDIIRTFTGVRPSSTHKDFYIKESDEVKGFIHVAGIDSPGLSAAPAIGRYVVEDIIKAKENFKPNKDFNPRRKGLKLFHQMSEEEKKEAFRFDPRHGNLICKCEKVTEADVVHAIGRNVPGDTVKGIKKRSRAGAGLCQGGYCEHNVIHLIAREKNKPITKVEYYDKGSYILKSETKVKK